FTASEQNYLAYARRFPTAELRQADLRRWELELILGDGLTYPQKGHIYFADRQVDVKTGAIRLAGLFPNPGNSLRPGQYAKVRAATDIQRGALLVPQKAIMDLQGARQIAVVDGGNKVARRQVLVQEHAAPARLRAANPACRWRERDVFAVLRVESRCAD